PQACDDGVVACRVEGSDRWVVHVDRASGRREEWPQTRADAPQWPTRSGDFILYVRDSKPRGLRALDTRTGRVHPVRYAGLGAEGPGPLFVVARGADVAVTFASQDKTHINARTIATGTCPPAAVADTLQIAGRWAVRLGVYDPRVCWLPDEDALFASILVSDPAEEAAMCVLRRGGRLRRVTYGLRAARAPVCAAGTLAFLVERGELHRAAVDPHQFAVPSVRVFAPAAPAPTP